MTVTPSSAAASWSSCCCGPHESSENWTCADASGTPRLAKFLATLRSCLGLGPVEGAGAGVPGLSSGAARA
jgi:hypothetical protein